MKYRLLGKTGFHVSEIGFGGWAIGGASDLFGIPIGWSSVDDKSSSDAISRAVDLGVNFFDTADVYGGGHSEQLLGSVLSGKEVYIASKVGNTRKDGRGTKDFSEHHIRQTLEGTLRRLKREAIDLYQLHNPPPEIWQAGDVFSTLQTLKKEGKIRAAGVSISSIEEGIHLIENNKVDCLQVLFNVLNQKPAERLFPLAERNETGIIVRAPLASGLLTGKFQRRTEFALDDNRRNYLTPKRMEEALDHVEKFRSLCGTGVLNPETSMPQNALAFILSFRSISTAIPGAKNPAQVEENVRGSDLQLPPETIRKIREDFSTYNFYLRYGIKI